MALNTPDPPAGGWLARLRGMVQARPVPDEAKAGEDLLPTWEESGAASPPAPAEAPAAAHVPVAEAVPVESEAAVPEPAAPAPLCPSCQSPRNGAQEYCDNCGWIFQDGPPAAPPAPAEPGQRVNQQYELGGRINQRGDVCRFRGRGFLSGDLEPLLVVLVRAPAAPAAEAVPAEEPPAAESEDVLAVAELPFDEQATQSLPDTLAVSPDSVWPGVAWEHARLEAASHPSLPRVIDRFTEGDSEYLVEELPVGRSLWDAWDDPAATAEQRFGWLKQIAEALDDLHQAGAILEGLRPDAVIVTDTGQARLTDLSDLLPLPLPVGATIRVTHATAPELVLSPEAADARADLYGFGAMLYALHVGRELADMDFERPGCPKPFIPLFPDAHPALARLLSKTFCRELAQRFPTDEAAREDSTGFRELIRNLDACGRTLDHVRLEIAAWTTTGMVRSGNEDAFALLHGTAGRQDDIGDSALVLLADGMGGYESGEVAAALAIQGLRRHLLQQRMFLSLTGDPSFWSDGEDAAPFDVEECKKLLDTALKEANKLVYNASRTGIGKRGMGCTAEVVYVNGRYVVAGHVGDSRTYHLHQGQLIQLTRDQTLVNRLVELGHLSEEEAKDHPRRSELQQAIGGYADVDPALYHGELKPGDWVVVCSDGLSNHVLPETLKDMLQTAGSAETAARRLVNLVNLEGATDNATVVVVRAT